MTSLGSTAWAKAVFVAALSLLFHGIYAIDHHSGMALQRAGASWTLIGAILAGWHYVRPSSITEQVAQRAPRVGGVFVQNHETTRRQIAHRNRMMPAIKQAVIAERYVAFGLICLGTLLNGYGDLLL